MAIDLEVALAAEPTVREASWTDRDVMLYQLGLGAGANALDPAELTWVYEKGLKVLPTFAMVAGQGVSAGVLPAPSMSMPGIDIDLRKILHGGQSLALHAPIPSTGAARISSRVADVWDKGKAAVIVSRDGGRGPGRESVMDHRNADLGARRKVDSAATPDPKLLPGCLIERPTRY